MLKITPVENLLLNMTAGLLPKDLTRKEVQLLKKEFGRNWFKILGYNTTEYKRPK